MTQASNRKDTIMIVDDDVRIRDLLRRYLTQEGFEVLQAEDGKALTRLLLRENVDLIVLDLMMPGEDGLSICRRLRAANDHTPIIMLTAKGEDVDQIVGLSVGADDYVPKPFSVKVLLARVEALLRRAGQGTRDESKTLELGPIAVDIDTHEARIDGQTVKLTLTEFRLLASLLQAAGKVLSRATLMSRAMGPGVMVTERTIDVHMTAIRKRLGRHAAMLKTVRGVGYKLSVELEAETT